MWTYHVNWGLGPGVSRQTWKDWMKPASKLIQISHQTSTSRFWLLFDLASLRQGIHPCDNLSNLCFCPVPFMVHGFSKSASKWEYRRLSWWSIQDTTLFLLSLSTLPRKVTFVYTQVKDIARSEVANKSRFVPVQTAAKPVENFSEEWCQEINSLTSHQNHSYYMQLLWKYTRHPDCWSEVSQLGSHLPANRPPNNAGLSLLYKVDGLF